MVLMGDSPGYERLRSFGPFGGGEIWCIAACAAICDAVKPEAFAEA